MFPTQDDKHKTDLNADNLKGGDDLDPNYVISCRVRAGRCVRGYSLSPHCTRAERRAVERIVADALFTLDGEFKGQYYNVTIKENIARKEITNPQMLCL